MSLFFLPVHDVLATPLAKLGDLQTFAPLFTLVPCGGVVQAFALGACKLDEFSRHGFLTQ